MTLGVRPIRWTPGLRPLTRSTDPHPQPNPTRWKTFKCYCSISCGFKIQKHKHQIREPSIGSSSLERDLGFQATTSLISSNSVSVAKNVKNPPRLPSRTCGVQTHEGEATGSPGLSRPCSEEYV